MAAFDQRHADADVTLLRRVRYAQLAPLRRALDGGHERRRPVGRQLRHQTLRDPLGLLAIDRTDQRNHHAGAGVVPTVECLQIRRLDRGERFLGGKSTVRVIGIDRGRESPTRDRSGLGRDITHRLDRTLAFTRDDRLGIGRLRHHAHEQIERGLEHRRIGEAAQANRRAVVGRPCTALRADHRESLGDRVLVQAVGSGVEQARGQASDTRLASRIEPRASIEAQLDVEHRDGGRFHEHHAHAALSAPLLDGGRRIGDDGQERQRSGKCQAAQDR